MHLMYFTERPYRYVSNDEVIKTGFFGIENKYFDSVKGGQLLNEYLDEKILAEELGFDGVMLNDLQSTNGTRLNGVRITSTPISDGDEIRVGETALTYLADEDPRARG